MSARLLAWWWIWWYNTRDQLVNRATVFPVCWSGAGVFWLLPCRGDIVIRKLVGIPALCGVLLVATSCITVNLPEEISLLPVETGFVLKGTSAVVDNGGPCLVWFGQNGLTYHLFQNPRVDNATFDRVVTPGVTSRLELAKRNDLHVTCELGSILEVQNVLEIEE